MSSINVNGILAPNIVRRVTALQRFALATYGLPYGEARVGVVDGSIECVAIWMQTT